MYTDENYFWGLVAYSLGVIAMLPLLYCVSRLFYFRVLKLLFWLVSLTVLLTPAQAYPDTKYLAPAWLVAVFEFVRPVSEIGPARAVTPMIAILMGLIAFCTVAWLVVVLFRRRNKAGREKPAEEAAA